MTDVATGPGWELRLGDHRDVLADVRFADALISDPMYSERTARGQRSNRTSEWLGSPELSSITYGWLTRSDLLELVDLYAMYGRLRRWWAMFGDHLTVRWALERLSALGWYDFAPCVWVKTNPAPRILSDGPSPTVEQLAVARPCRRLSRAEKRHRRSDYRGPQAPPSERIGLIGQKPLWLMQAVVRDYSEPGDLVIDPFAGAGTTLLAAVIEGRRAVGAELDRGTFDQAVARLRALEPVIEEARA